MTTSPTATNLSTTTTPRRDHRPTALQCSAELATAARYGDDEAAGELYRRTMRRARVAARSFCADADADDAVAEGLSRALRRLDQLSDAAAVERWMIRCAVRAAIDLSRKRQRQPAIATINALAERSGPPAESAADQALSAMEQGALASVLRQLQPGPRLLLQLRYEKGLSVEHIAVALGRPAGTIRRQCVEARRLVGQRFLGQQLRPASGDCSRVTELLCQAPYRRLSGLARRRLDEHLGQCPGCRDREQELDDRLTELGFRSRHRAA